MENDPNAVCWCLVGALRAVSGDPDAYEEAYEAVAQYLNKSPAGWNDAPGRTQAEVIAVLRYAAAAIEREER
jgi:hypothetical protein